MVAAEPAGTASPRAAQRTIGASLILRGGRDDTRSQGNAAERRRATARLGRGRAMAATHAIDVPGQQHDARRKQRDRCSATTGGRTRRKPCVGNCIAAACATPRGVIRGSGRRPGQPPPDRCARCATAPQRAVPATTERGPRTFSARTAPGVGRSMPQRITSTGTWLLASTSAVWLPSRTRLMPRRPCEVITIRSLLQATAMSMMPSAA